jgi:F-type H+-transporting ATPase subunit alpha
LRGELGGGSLTALPIIETEAQDISAYIPTNLISITDGQIYLSPTLFELGMLPAIDVSKSVSRVGGKAQRPIYLEVAGDLKLDYAQFEELETFARFGARLDEDSRKIIEHGRRIRACLKQPESAPVSVPEQIAVLLVLAAGLFDDVPLDKMAEAELAVRQAIAPVAAQICERTGTTGGMPGKTSAENAGGRVRGLTGAERQLLVQQAGQALAPFKGH